jgi:hypothetical protein
MKLTDRFGKMTCRFSIGQDKWSEKLIGMMTGGNFRRKEEYLGKEKR